jgi:hypothetical protein
VFNIVILPGSRCKCFFQIMLLAIVVILSTVVIKTVTSVHCYECTDYVTCGSNGQGTVVTNCPACMVYRNQHDNSTYL